MVLEIEYSRLQKWVKNFADNIKNSDIEFYTLSAKIGFNDSSMPNGENLKEFADKMVELKANGFRLYFIRYDKDKEGDGEYLGTGRPPVYFANGLSQVSIAMVPTVNDGLDVVRTGDKKDKVWVLVPGGETSGLCPVDCGNS